MHTLAENMAWLLARAGAPPLILDDHSDAA
jgi:hypothetical protein